VRKIEASKATQDESKIEFSVKITPYEHQDGHCLVELELPSGQEELAELWKIYLWVLEDKKTILGAPLELSYAKNTAKEGGSEKPATAVEPKSEGKEEPKPESEARSQ
jgi:hypothetical protein